MSISNKTYNKNSKFRIFIILFSVFYFLLSGALAQAALIPCGPGTEKATCEFCDLASLVSKVINFAWYIVIPLAAVFIAWGGIMILMAGGSPEKAKNGKDIITAAVIGVVIVLIAWLIINTLLQILTTEQGFNPWNFGKEKFC